MARNVPEIYDTFWLVWYIIPKIKGRPDRGSSGIDQHQLGVGAGPIGEMRKVQSGFLVVFRPVHRHHGERGEDPVAGVHLHGHSP